MDNREAAIRAKNLLTERSEGSVDISLPRIRAIIPTALEAWTRTCFTDREKRELLKKDFTGDLEDGLLDLTPFTDGTDGRINLKELRQTVVYRQVLSGDTVTSETPYTWLNSYQQLRNSRPIASDLPACFLEGSTLRTRTASGGFVDDAQVRFTVTSYPALVTEVPKELEHDFIMALANVVMQTK